MMSSDGQCTGWSAPPLPLDAPLRDFGQGLYKAPVVILFWIGFQTVWNAFESGKAIP